MQAPEDVAELRLAPRAERELKKICAEGKIA
jgi:hypothetical protein